MTTPDRQLLERAREGEPEALAEIYDRYSLPIYRYLFRILGDAALAEDLTSDVFLRLLQVLNTLRAPRDRLEDGSSGWPITWPWIGSAATRGARRSRWQRS